MNKDITARDLGISEDLFQQLEYYCEYKKWLTELRQKNEKKAEVVFGYRGTGGKIEVGENPNE